MPAVVEMPASASTSAPTPAPAQEAVAIVAAERDSSGMGQQRNWARASLGGGQSVHGVRERAALCDGGCGRCGVEAGGWWAKRRAPNRTCFSYEATSSSRPRGRACGQKQATATAAARKKRKKKRQSEIGEADRGVTKRGREKKQRRRAQGVWTVALVVGCQPDGVTAAAEARPGGHAVARA